MAGLELVLRGLEFLEVGALVPEMLPTGVMHLHRQLAQSPGVVREGQEEQVPVEATEHQAHNLAVVEVGLLQLHQQPRELEVLEVLAELF
jgi:hypothetical protein